MIHHTSRRAYQLSPGDIETDDWNKVNCPECLKDRQRIEIRAGDFTNPDAPASAMTIREHMAVEFMKGLLSDPNIRDSSVEISAGALKCVDALLVALNKKGEK